MKLHDLYVLMTVAQAGSMRKAAASLNTNQPSISRSIAELEATVGAPLLDRTPQGVETTAYGRALLDGGVAMFDDLRQAVRHIEFLANPESGDIRIGSGYHHARSFVFTVVDRLSRRYPRVIFHLVSQENTELLERDLYERKVDLLVARRWSSISDERLAFEFLFNDPYFVVAGKQHPLARRRHINPAELSTCAWVLPSPESPPGSIIVEAFRASGVDYPHVTVFATLPDLRMRLVETGRYLTVFTRSVLTSFSTRPHFKILPINPALPDIPTGVVTLKNRTLSPVAKLFIEHAHEAAKPFGRRR